jgi:tetratricopeptide (TPR) repeat protein
MKKIFVLLLFIASAGVLPGQKPIDILMKGKALIEQGKPDDAVRILSDALGRSQESTYYLLRAEAFITKGDFSSAINDLNSANTAAPSSGEYALARIYGLKGDAETAVYHLESCMKSSFKKSEKEILLDPSFSLIENRPEWRQFWKNDWYGNLEKGISGIEYNISTGNIGEAKTELKELTGLYPGNNKINYAGALINLAESKNGEAVKYLTALLNEEPVNENYLRLFARAQEASGNQAGASNTYTRLLDLGVPDASLLLSRAECYRKTGETEKALTDVNKYLEFYPGNDKALSFAGKLESAGGDNLKALEYFSKNLKLHPNDPQCYIDRANSYFASKSWDWAAKDYSMALDLKPDISDAWLNKGIALLNSGKTDDACHDFRKSFNLGNRKATEYVSRYCIR